MDNAIRDIFINFRTKYLNKYKPTYEQSKVFNKIIKCHTEELGTRIYKCEECGHNVFSYNSCKDRHCPNCQAYRKEVWVENHKNEILDITYFHVVMTIPSELHPIFYHNQRVCYNLLFKSCSETLMELLRDEKYLGCEIGITAMLHTWSQKGNYHPHIHMIVTGGGIDKLGKWKESKKDFLVPVKVLSRKFRGKLLSKLKEEEMEFYNKYEYLNDKDEYKKYLDKMYKKEWVCYCKEPFRNVGEIYEYLGRYAFRVCISNERIIKVTDTHVYFSYKDHKDRSKKKVLKIKGEDFIMKFLLNVLPKSFMKIRYYGIISGKNKTKKIEQLKKLTKTFRLKKEKLTKLEIINKLIRRDVTKCTKCNGEMKLIKEIKRKKPPDKKRRKENKVC